MWLKLNSGVWLENPPKISAALMPIPLVNSETPWNSPTRWTEFHNPLLLDLRSIDISGAQEKEGHFHYKKFLRASKWGTITCHTSSIIRKSLYCGLGLIPIQSKDILGWSSRYGMRYLISKLSKSFYYERGLLFLVYHWCQLTSDLRGVWCSNGVVKFGRISTIAIRRKGVIKIC